MLFNSYVFLFAFLPATLAGFALACRLGPRAGSVWLVAASLAFYGWWYPPFLWVLLASIAFNYTMSELIGRARPPLAGGLLAIAIAGDLGALFYYKYLVAVLGFLHAQGVAGPGITHIALPLGISFFTFTQIGYLVDVAQGVAKDRGLLRYVLFVTFFPHLIAGPILHNREVMPQLALPSTWRISGTNLAIGSAIFIAGLLKKCLLADPLAATVAPGFVHPHPADLGLFAAWHTALAYSLQLYFDFSGYSDMAIGLARLFNLRFPQNFNSPYKAASVIDYWQRWHMTLSRYLNLYLYNPLALAITRRRAARGHGVTRQATATASGFASLVVLPTIFTMTLAGIWHGAGLQFLVFGLLHGSYLVVNHAWRVFGPKIPRGGDPSHIHVGKIALTYLCVLAAAVFFRAPSCLAATNLLAGMTGLHGLGDLVRLPAWTGLARYGQATVALGDTTRAVVWLGCLYAIVWLLPNTQQIMRDYEPALGRIQLGPWPSLAWRPSLPWAAACGLGATVGALAIGGTTEFLYFQF